MQDYISLRLNASPCTEDITDLAAALLGEIGFESFDADSEGLTAYIKDSLFDKTAAEEALNDFPIPTRFSLSHELVKGENWNEEWEKNYFKPIVVDNQCVIHSTFHTEIPDAPYDIIVDPKMAFGTGHHSTTYNMLKLILSSDMTGKSVIDMGTGTGILSILSSMREASSVIGIEIDPFAWENAVDNVKLNNVDADMLCGDASLLSSLKPVDFFLANINRNVILNDIAKYSSVLKEGGEMFLSGFYSEDVPMVTEAAEAYGLECKECLENNNWIALRLVKKEKSN